MRSLRFVLFLLIFFCAAKAHGQNWKAFADTAKVFQDQKNNASAIGYYLKANELLKKDSAVTVSYARNNNDIADIYVAIGQYGKAEPFYADALLVTGKMQGKENPDYASVCNNLGRLYRLLGQYEKSEPLLLDARRIREKTLGKENADYATSCNNLAALYLDVGQYEMAKPLYLEAKEIRERVLGKNHVDYATSCNNLAIWYVVTGSRELAEPLYLEAKQIRENVLGKEHPFYAASCNNLGALYLDMGQYNKAEPLYIESRQIRERTLGRQHPDYAASCDNLAILYLNTGQYEKAEPLYLEAKGIREQTIGPRHPEYARSCNNLAVFYRTLGQYEKAEPLFNEARNVFASVPGKEHPLYATSCNNLGALYMSMDNDDKAEALYQEAKNIWEKIAGKEHPEYAKTCHNLGLVYLRKGQLEKAESSLVEANQVREKALGKNHPDYAQGCDNLAEVYKEMGQLSKAAGLHEEAREIREKLLGKEHLEYIESSINLANSNWSLKEFGKASNNYKDAFNAERGLVKKLFRFTTEQEKQSYLGRLAAHKNYFLSFCSFSVEPEPGHAYTVLLANRNLTLSTSQQLRSSVYNAPDTNVKSKYNKWIGLREQISFWNTRPIADRPVFVIGLEREANDLEKELTLISAEFKREQQQQKETDWKNVQQQLKPGEASIEFAEFQYYNGLRWTDSILYIALVLRKDKPGPELVTLFERKQLNKLMITDSGADQGGKNFVESIYQSSAVYNLIWQPLEKNLKGITKIYFAPAGLLHRISLSAIPVTDKQVLSDKYQLVQLNTTASVVNLPVNSLSVSGKIAVYGGIRYDVDSSLLRQASQMYATNSVGSGPFAVEISRGDRGNAWSYLPGTQQEIREIERLGKQKKMSLEVFNDVNATEESIKSFNKKNSPSVLHIATHGFFFPDPKERNEMQNKYETSGKAFRQSDNPLFRSGLLFAGANNTWKGKPVDGVEDGILTAYEVSNFYLPNTKLVVLSACETGLGDIQGSEGVYGLQRSFKMAGVQNLVMSLWKVPDVATSEFMKLFYQNMFNMQSISDAFYNAQAKMKNKYRDNPYNWAAWVLVR